MNMFPNRRYIAVILAVVLMMVAGTGNSSGSEESTTITLHQLITVYEDIYTVGQACEIVTKDQELSLTLGKIVLGNSPRPGQSLYMHQSNVIQKIKEAGYDTSDWSVSGEGPLKVIRGYHTAGSAEIADTVRQFIEKSAPWESSQMKIRPIDYRQEHRLAPGKVTYEVSAPKHTDWLGAESFPVDILVDGSIVKRTSVPVFIEVWSEVALAAKPLSRGAPIAADDIRMEKMNLSRVPADVVMHADEIMGKRANRSIAINSILRQDQIEQLPLIRKGDIVEVLVETDQMKIATQAVAREDGVKGACITLTNVNSKKNIQAAVIDSRTVQVLF